MVNDEEGDQRGTLDREHRLHEALEQCPKRDCRQRHGDQFTLTGVKRLQELRASVVRYRLNRQRCRCATLRWAAL